MKPQVRTRKASRHGIAYKWIALSNTTLGVLMATINTTSLIIALPTIFRGIGVNPLAPGKTSVNIAVLLANRKAPPIP